MPPKAKKKTDTTHKMSKTAIRMVPDTPTGIKETHIENPHKKTTLNPPIVQIHKEEKVEDKHMKEETIYPDLPTQ